MGKVIVVAVDRTQYEVSRLRAVRESQGKTLLEVATPAGISESYLSKVERGHKRPTVTVLRAIAVELHLDDLVRTLDLFVREAKR